MKKARAFRDSTIGKPTSTKRSSSSVPSNPVSNERKNRSGSQVDNINDEKHHHHHHHHYDMTNNISEVESHFPSTYEDYALKAESQILFTSITDLMPYGDGSNKVFGYENFGNTCYCNSVLQCLYNIPEFRCNVLRYPERIPVSNRIRKSNLTGSKVRVFTNESFEVSTNGGSSNSGSQTYDNEDVHNHHHYQHSDLDNSSSSTQEKQSNNERKRNSFMGFGKGKSSIKDSTKKEDSYEVERPRPVHTVVMASDVLTEKLHEGCKRIIVGRSLPIQGDSSSRTAHADHKSIHIRNQKCRPVLTNQWIDDNQCQLRGSLSYCESNPTLTNESFISNQVMQRKKACIN